MPAARQRPTCRPTAHKTTRVPTPPQVCHTEDEDFRGDFGLPLLTEHDVDCIKTLGWGGAGAYWAGLAGLGLGLGGWAGARPLHSRQAARCRAAARGPAEARCCAGPFPACSQLRRHPPPPFRSAQFEVDFVNLSFCNCVEDLYAGGAYEGALTH